MDFIQVPPIEYQLRVREKKSPRIIRSWDIEYSQRLDQDKLDRVVREIHTRRKVSITRDSYHYLFWQYKGEPSIALKLLTNEIGTTKGNLKLFGERKCQIQASIVLKVLKKYGPADIELHH